MFPVVYIVKDTFPNMKCMTVAVRSRKLVSEKDQGGSNYLLSFISVSHYVDSQVTHQSEAGI